MSNRELLVGFTQRGLTYGAVSGGLLGAFYGLGIASVLGAAHGLAFGASVGAIVGAVDAFLIGVVTIRGRLASDPAAYRRGAVTLGTLVASVGTGAMLWLVLGFPQALSSRYYELVVDIAVPVAVAALAGWWATNRGVDWYLNQRQTDASE